MNINSLIENKLDSNVIDQLSSVTGIDNREQTKSATQEIISSLLGAMSKNASTPEGANALNEAINNDHDGGILDNIMGYLQGSESPGNQSTINGSGILNHVLGENQSSVTDAISKITNLDKDKISGLMEKLAPIVMGMLGKSKQASGEEGGGISSILSSILSGQGSIMDKVTSALDKDKDGNMLDDILGDKVGGMLGGLFNKK